MQNRPLISHLDERIRLERLIATPDDQGGQITSWSLLAECWAAVTPLLSSSREGSRAAQSEAMAGYRIRIRHRADVDATMRCIWRGRVLAIHSLHEVPGYLHLLTYEEQL